MGMCDDGNCPECQERKAKQDLAPEPQPAGDFRDFHRDLDRIVRRGFLYRNGGKPFRRTFDPNGRPQGKAAIKAAKRARVKAMKAEQAEA